MAVRKKLAGLAAGIGLLVGGFAVSAGPGPAAADEQVAAELPEPVTSVVAQPEVVDEAAAALPPRRRLWTLQMNLCSNNRPSAGGSCDAEDDPDRDGEEIAEGGRVMSDKRPDIVTLNELCKNDFYALWNNRWMPMWPSDVRWALWVAAKDRNGDPKLCHNGKQFGNAIMGHVPTSEWRDTVIKAGWYQEQDGTNERRNYGCVYARGAYFACVTHLSTVEEVAATQCAELDWRLYLFEENHGGQRQTVVGGDFNLRTLDPDYPMTDCVGDGWSRTGDGDRQHVLYTNNISREIYVSPIPMTYTDHPALLVKLRDTQPR